MFVKLLDNSEGFSLIETMSGIILLTIAIFPALGYFANSVDFVHQTEIRSQAMDIAADTMEYFKMVAKDESLDMNTQAAEFNNNRQIEVDIKSGYNLFIDEYDIDVDITAYEITDNNEEVIGNIKKIVVKVYWNDKSKSVQLSSLLRGDS